MPFLNTWRHTHVASEAVLHTSNAHFPSSTDSILCSDPWRQFRTRLCPCAQLTRFTAPPFSPRLSIMSASPNRTPSPVPSDDDNSAGLDVTPFLANKWGNVDLPCAQLTRFTAPPFSPRLSIMSASPNRTPSPVPSDDDNSAGLDVTPFLANKWGNVDLSPSKYTSACGLKQAWVLERRWRASSSQITTIGG
jgi:hypothetical protein